MHLWNYKEIFTSYVRSYTVASYAAFHKESQGVYSYYIPEYQ